jgi:tRNA (cmo5U34)-methyltransferase
VSVDRDTEHGGRWEFNQEVADVFDNMLERSIPQYHRMREAVFAIGRRFVRPTTLVVDLGCSRGEALAPFAQLDHEGPAGGTTRCIGVETSPAMVAAARERFAGDKGVAIVEADLRRRDSVPRGATSLTLLVLTLQFVPIEYRARVLADVRRATVDGGALILVEKVVTLDGLLDEMFRAIYHDTKLRAGYGQGEVERKRLALEGVLVPRSADENERALYAAGFRHVECFWRWLNFAGWVAIA